MSLQYHHNTTTRHHLQHHHHQQSHPHYRPQPSIASSSSSSARVSPSLSPAIPTAHTYQSPTIDSRHSSRPPLPSSSSIVMHSSAHPSSSASDRAQQLQASGAPRRPLSPSHLRDVDLSARAPDSPHANGVRYPPPLTGHELMALFPPPAPSLFPDSRPRNTSMYFESQERAFFAKAGKEIVRVRIDVDMPQYESSTAPGSSSAAADLGGKKGKVEPGGGPSSSSAAPPSSAPPRWQAPPPLPPPPPQGQQPPQQSSRHAHSHSHHASPASAHSYPPPPSTSSSRSAGAYSSNNGGPPPSQSSRHSPRSGAPLPPLPPSSASSRGGGGDYGPYPGPGGPPPSQQNGAVVPKVEYPADYPMADPGVIGYGPVSAGAAPPQMRDEMAMAMSGIAPVERRRSGKHTRRVVKQ